MANDKKNENHQDFNENPEDKTLESGSTHASDSDELPSASSHPKQILITDTELKNLQKELIEYKDKYLRLLADVENSRKRMQKERQELTKYAIENIIVDFLKPLDNLENALKFAQNMSDEVKNWAFGFQMILTQFKDVLAENGVHSIDSLGTQFNPHEHEAVETCEISNQTSGTILEEYMRGYKMGERTIRPAKVKVATAKDKQPVVQKQPQENEDKQQ